ncbi:MAG TPA: helix-turn-helix domain-containing protein, partial [Mariprofundaceae bacterium]|nr:helix-turn-helix domain-containing protein [Mariprofundaceae bacterium]
MSDETLHSEAETCSNIEDATSREELLHELAQCLKKARKSRQLNSEEIALTLKLRPVYIDALESGDWSEMPGEVYALGFLKQYAAFLDVDVSDTIEKLKTGQYKLTKPLTFPDPPIAPNKTWVIVAALAFVVILILFNLIDSEPTEEPAHLAPEVSDIAALTDAPTAEPVAVAESVAENEQKPVVTESLPADEPAAPVSPPIIKHAYKLSAVGEDVWFQLSIEKKGDT